MMSYFNAVITFQQGIYAGATNVSALKRRLTNKLDIH